MTLRERKDSKNNNNTNHYCPISIWIAPEAQIALGIPQIFRVMLAAHEVVTTLSVHPSDAPSEFKSPRLEPFSFAADGIV